jgi:hypothetical protein
MTPIKKGENSSKPNVGGPISRLGYLLLLRALKRARGSLKMLTNVDLERAPDLKNLNSAPRSSETTPMEGRSWR